MLFPMIPKPSKYLKVKGMMLKNEQMVSSTKRCAHMISGFKQLLAKVTYYDEPPLIHTYTCTCMYMYTSCSNNIVTRLSHSCDNLQYLTISFFSLPPSLPLSLSLSLSTQYHLQKQCRNKVVAIITKFW